MGMRTGNQYAVRSAGSAGAAYSTGTSSYPVTGFPASAYLGNNRRLASGKQSQQPNTMAALGNVASFDPLHLVIVLGILIVVGYGLWHLDNGR